MPQPAKESKSIESTSVISSFSLAFIKHFRASFLFLLAVIVLGAFSYTTFLKREGFPPIEVPYVIVQSTYFVGDPSTVAQEVTGPIEAVMSELEDIKSIQSSTSDFVSVVFAEFGGSQTASSAEKAVKDALTTGVKLPEGATWTTSTIDAGAVDGEHALLFNLSGDFSPQELQAKAAEVSAIIVEHPLITEAAPQDLITPQTNPLTGETFDYQSRFSRVGYQQNGELVFKPAIAIGVNKQAETGTFELSDAVREEIKKLTDAGILEGYTVTYGGDFAVSLQSQFDSLESNALSGLIAVVIILLLLVSWRASILGIIFIPTVMGATFVGLYLIGYSLNVISLFALILVLGLIVDDAIVVVEAIDRKVHQGFRGIKAVRAAINDIGLADISGTITTMLVFVPMAFTGGVLGEFIRRIPITVILALFISLFVGLSVTPLLSMLLLNKGNTQEKPKKTLASILDRWLGFLSPLITAVEHLLGRWTRWYLKNIWRALPVMAVAILLIGAGLSYAGKLKFSIFPTPKDSDQLSIMVTYLPGTEVPEAESIAMQIEDMVNQEIGAETLNYTYYTADARETRIAVDLTAMGTRAAAGELVDQLQTQIDSSLGDKAKVKVSLISAGPPMADFPFAMQIYSEESATLENAVAAMSAELSKVVTPAGVTVVDTLVADMKTITRVDTRRFVEIKAKLSVTEDTQALLDVQKAMEEAFPESKLEALGLMRDGMKFDFGQESENLDSFEGTIFATIAALILMYALLVVLYNSFSQPILIFLAIPFSFTGLFPGLYFTDNALSFFVMLGILALIGIAVNNTIMLVDYANRKRREDPNSRIRDDIAKAVEIRFRPIMTTTATTIAGLLPLALTDPFWEALSFSIIFGMISSTIMVLFFFPAFYWTMERVRFTIKKRLPQIPLTLDEQAD